MRNTRVLFRYTFLALLVLPILIGYAGTQACDCSSARSQDRAACCQDHAHHLMEPRYHNCQRYSAGSRAYRIGRRRRDFLLHGCARERNVHRSHTRHGAAGRRLHDHGELYTS